MRSFLPVVCSVFLISYGCAGGESTTATGFGGDDGGGGDDAGIITGDATTSNDGATGDAATDSGPLKTCVHNDDCTVPNLCSGTNGVACMGGFCVPTGKAENCDDGVACTDDSCDANANKCKHTPNDASCPNGSYCDTTMNCVQTLPCMTAGDTVCDRLDTTSCDGLWSCDTVHKYCVHGAKPCLDRANATTTCTPMGQNQTCSYACTMGYVDANMDLNSMGTSNGCECHATDLIDVPTLANVDGNCDGIVGNIANAIFVAKSGNDGNPGTMALPKLTIQAGIAAAAATTPVKDVYVSIGTYAESVSMADGVSIFGGYDAANGWSRASNNVALIDYGQANHVGVTADHLTKAVQIQLMSVTARDASGTLANGDGRSSYGIVITSCSGGVTVRGCTVVAGSGAPGSAGTNGSTGNAGGLGGTTTTTAHGAGGTGCNGANGGPGADSVSGPVTGNTGTAGTQASGGGAGAPPGTGGGAGQCDAINASSGGPAPVVSSNGGPGGPGNDGSGGGPFGSVDGAGVYDGSFGIDGMTAGFPGGGGGGGGSGGGSANGTLGSACTNCNALAGGAGGGGGGGGCGGGVGHGGRGGGGSFAIVIVSTTATIDSTKMTTANGGAGGTGGQGGTGGTGGLGGGGSGGTGGGSSPCGHYSGGPGAGGSQGGAGGKGGGAGGGGGGPTVCIVYKGTSPSTPNVMCTRGSAGAGGSGGGNGGAPVGQPGTAVDSTSSP